MSAEHQVGFIGLGAMGSGMAVNLHKYLQSTGRQLRVWNRTLSKTAELESLGAVIRKDGPNAVAKVSDIIFSMVFDDKALKETYENIISSPVKGLIWVDCSTVYPATTREVAEKVEANGMRFCSCPVFGRPDAARAKLLVGALAGPEDVKQVVRPYIESMTRAIMDIGEEPHLASTQKLMGNFFITASIETIAEAQTLADKTGLSRKNVMDFINTLLPTPILQGYGGRICSDQFTINESSPGFPVRGGLKDVGLMRRLAEESSVKLPIADVAYEHLQKQVEKGNEELDWGSIALSVREESGL